MDQLTQIIIEANKHKGMSVVDVLQPCVSLNKELTHEFYRENIYYLGDDYDPTNKNAALEKALEFGLKKIPLGIFYKEESSRTDEDKVGTIDQNRDGYDYNKLFKKYT
jgi:2-oxoglutarate ferredoxin oxidoreductase subunit beta